MIFDTLPNAHTQMYDSMIVRVNHDRGDTHGPKSLDYASRVE
ncbi:hypothetical protein SAMN05421677_12339 [Halobacillus aidingensis]|uniref:Uncharacterized protein n=1 Tax=Halobacillus aidingensis TaxID=240303 RepID=A0A1H0TZ72_HALAD|nr:hypothetical protein SAMN05421677_12339 [Halobacillus aidingensis]